eukprot:11173757-Lingulodinium_polyedra.AAC.1
MNATPWRRPQRNRATARAIFGNMRVYFAIPARRRREGALCTHGARPRTHGTARRHIRIVDLRRAGNTMTGLWANIAAKTRGETMNMMDDD